MAGHSKWAQIKRKKAVVDAKRGKVFTRLIREITVAARMGGGEEDANPRLRQAVLAAKAANMPADNVKRAIQRGTGELPGVTYEEAVFEGYGPGGVAIMMEVMTDNRKRTVAEIRHLMTMYGGNLGASGCVAWMFEKKGLVTVDKNEMDEDRLLETVLEGGGDDFVEEEDVYEITSEPERMADLKHHLEHNRFTVTGAEISNIPRDTARVEGETARKVINLMESLEDHDDIQTLSSNFDMDEVVIAEVQ